MDIEPTLQLSGSVDRVDETAIEGWIALCNSPTKVGLDVLLDGEPIGHCVADQYRQDLEEANIAGGNCAFSFPMPAFVPTGRLNHIKLRISNSPVYLEMPNQAEGEADTRSAHPTISRFGGLWIDRYDFVDTLAKKHRAGEISDEVSDQITHFVRDGYVVLKGAVSEEILELLNADIERVWRDPPESLRIETFKPDGEMVYIKPDLAYRDGATKLLDLYAVSGAARAASANPAVFAFLSAIFEDAPKAFQGLTFWNGSQQAIHKDTAYVKVDSNLMHLAASWLALEDIQPGTGELEFYVGSHRAPDFLFGGNSKWMEAHVDEHPNFLLSLHEDAKRFRQVRKSFLGKAGDVLIWHADLAHGGAPIKNIGQTRRSLVTHFCPARDEPFYRRNAKHEGTEVAGVEFVSQYGNVHQSA